MTWPSITPLWHCDKVMWYFPALHLVVVSPRKEKKKKKKRNINNNLAVLPSHDTSASRLTVWTLPLGLSSPSNYLEKRSGSQWLSIANLCLQWNRIMRFMTKRCSLSSVHWRSGDTSWREPDIWWKSGWTTRTWSTLWWLRNSTVARLAGLCT